MGLQLDLIPIICKQTIYNTDKHIMINVKTQSEQKFPDMRDLTILLYLKKVSRAGGYNKASSCQGELGHSFLADLYCRPTISQA